MSFAASLFLEEMMDGNVDVDSLYEKLFSFSESQQLFRKLELYLVVAVKLYQKIVLDPGTLSLFVLQELQRLN